MDLLIFVPTHNQLLTILFKCSYFEILYVTYANEAKTTSIKKIIS